MVSAQGKQKEVALSSVLRSAIQTTNSTLIGCSANTAVPMKLRPVNPRRPPQDPKQQQGIQHMQRKIHLVVPTRLQLKQLDIERVRQPGQRMPIVKIRMQQRPLHRRPPQHPLDIWVCRHAAVVVKIDEKVAMHWGVKHHDRDREQQT